MFNNILIATDGSNHAFKALSIAADLAAKYNAKLTILHVLMHGKVPAGFQRMAEIEHIDKVKNSPSAELYNIPASLVTSLRNVKPDTNEDLYFDVVARTVTADSKRKAEEAGAKDVSTQIVAGDAAEQIADIAAAQSIDLIVIGTRGLGDIKRLLLGSVASKVSQIAECPCLTVK